MIEVIVNKSFGGFHLGKEFCARYGYSPYEEILRTDTHLVEWVKNHPNDNPSLKVVVVPDNATDWQIHDYDGLEAIIMAIDGKIVWG